MFAVRVPQGATLGVWATGDNQRTACGRKAGTHGVQDFRVGVGAKFVRMPKRCFVGDYGDVGWAAQTAKARAAHLDANAVREFERVCGAAGDQLTQYRRLLERSVAVVKHDARLLLVRCDAEDNARFTGCKIVFAQATDIRGKCGHSARFPASPANDCAQFFDALAGFAWASSQCGKCLAFVVGERLAHCCDQ
jgi:hypothetical protein